MVKGVGAVDDRRDLPGREEVGQGEQVLALPDRHERPQLLTGEPGQHARLHDPTEGAEPAATASAVGDEGAGGRQRSADSRQGLGFHVVEDDVVALLGAGEVGPRVVDDMVGTERPDQVDVTGAAHTRYLGADHVIDYTTTDFTSTDRRYDVILDNVEAQPLADVRRALTPTGTLIPNSGRGGRWLGPLGRIVKARVLSGFTRQQLKPLVSVAKRQDLLTLADLLATGQVTPVIDRTYPLDEAADALRYVAAGHTRGKVVVTV